MFFFCLSRTKYHTFVFGPRVYCCFPRGRAFRVLRSGEEIDSGFGTLTFEKPSVVRVEDNTVETGVSWASVCCVILINATGCFLCRVYFVALKRLFVFPSGILTCASIRGCTIVCTPRAVSCFTHALQSTRYVSGTYFAQQSTRYISGTC